MRSIVRQRAPLRLRPKRESIALLAAYCIAHDCAAIDRVVLDVRQISTAKVQASGATLLLDMTPERTSGAPSLHAQIAELRLPRSALAVREPGSGAPHPAPGNRVRNIDIDCTGLIVRKPQFGCAQGSLSAAGTLTRFNGRFQAGTWSLSAEADSLDLGAALALAQPWFRLPQGDSLSGHVQLRLQSNGQLDSGEALGRVQARLTASSSDLNYSNQAGTLVAQNLATTLGLGATRDRGRLATDLQLRSSNGQLLAGAVLLDFAKNPLNLHAHLEPSGNRLACTQIRLNQTDLIDAQGSADISWPGEAVLQERAISVERAHFDVSRLEFAAAYRSFLQLSLATTDFGALNVGGRASGSLDMAHNEVSQLDAYLQNVSMADSTTRLSLANANGQVHWASSGGTAVQPSQLSWSSSSAYGLIGGPVQMSFTAHGAEFTLGSNTRFPIFDGALVIHTLALRRLGDPETELDFDAHLEPISMPLLSKAFGWPILSGQLAGAIPGVTYRDRVLAVQGDLTANVFDGTIIASHLKLSDPSGPWPRMTANVAARHLDLDLVTHTFSIGSISGRMDADIQGLELFNWSPIAFDARLQTTPGDRSKHLISQRAVTSISSVGGGGGGVAAALQSGVLKFFDQFHYDRIGISCQLRDEVCIMSGLEPAQNGYYLVKGRGLPRIDIIGNAGRVDWTQLVGQITASMHSQGVLVR